LRALAAFGVLVRGAARVGVAALRLSCGDAGLPAAAVGRVLLVSSVVDVIW
jgi:hypothetical protein